MSDNKSERVRKNGCEDDKEIKWGVIMYGIKQYNIFAFLRQCLCRVYRKESHCTNKPRKRETRTVAHKKKFVCKAEKKIVCRQRRGAKKKRERHFTRYASYRQQQQKRVVGLWKSLFPWE